MIDFLYKKHLFRLIIVYLCKNLLTLKQTITLSLLLCFALCLLAQKARVTCIGTGGLRLPTYFTDNMVLPRERSFILRGMANAGEKVRVEVVNTQRGKVVMRKQAVAQLDGRWSIEVDPLPQGGPYTFTVRAKSGEVTLYNVLAGELWLASGQSNMTISLRNGTTAAADIKEADNDNIRLLNLLPRWQTDARQWPAEALDSVNRLLYFRDAEWKACKPATVSQFSAIAYHFARVLQDSLQCPVGIICNAVGGSGEEAWIDHETLELEFPEILRNWTENELLMDWVRERAKCNMGWNPKDAAHNPLQRHPYQPCYLYEASIRVLKDMPIRGVIWYQGESNAHNMETHARLFPMLLRSWRQTWECDTLPFIYAQLSSLNRPSWPHFRDLQRQQLYEQHALSPHLGMAVTSDVGDSLDVHPRNKRPVGERMALWALHNEYGYNGVCSGPLVRSFKQHGNEVAVHFDFSAGLHTSDGDAPRTFEVSEDSCLWHAAAARIEHDKVILTVRKGQKIRYIRYGWQPFTRANLINGASLPASTFLLQ